MRIPAAAQKVESAGIGSEECSPVATNAVILTAPTYPSLVPFVWQRAVRFLVWMLDPHPKSDSQPQEAEAATETEANFANFGAAVPISKHLQLHLVPMEWSHLIVRLLWKAESLSKLQMLQIMEVRQKEIS